LCALTTNSTPLTPAKDHPWRSNKYKNNINKLIRVH